MSDKSPIDEAAIPSADDAGNQVGRESPVARSKRKNILKVPSFAPSAFAAAKASTTDTRPMPGSDEEIDAFDARDAEAAPFGQPTMAVEPAAMPVVRARVMEVIPKRRVPVRVTFEVAGGSYSMPARGLVCTPGGIMVFFNHDDSAVTFSPAVGAEVVVSSGDMRMACYSVGLFFDVPELGVSILAMVARKE